MSIFYMPPDSITIGSGTAPSQDVMSYNGEFRLKPRMDIDPTKPVMSCVNVTAEDVSIFSDSRAQFVTDKALGGYWQSGQGSTYVTINAVNPFLNTYGSYRPINISNTLYRNAKEGGTVNPQSVTGIFPLRPTATATTGARYILYWGYPVSETAIRKFYVYWTWGVGPTAVVGIRSYDAAGANTITSTGAISINAAQWYIILFWYNSATTTQGISVYTWVGGVWTLLDTNTSNAAQVIQDVQENSCGIQFPLFAPDTDFGPSYLITGNITSLSDPNPTAWKIYPGTTRDLNGNTTYPSAIIKFDSGLVDTLWNMSSIVVDNTSVFWTATYGWKVNYLVGNTTPSETGAWSAFGSLATLKALTGIRGRHLWIGLQCLTNGYSAPYPIKYFGINSPTIYYPGIGKRGPL